VQEVVIADVGMTRFGKFLDKISEGHPVGAIGCAQLAELRIRETHVTAPPGAVWKVGIEDR
jgi:acetyl-CoA acetyltransferase